MFHTILGRSGYGKTEEIRRKIKETAAQGKKILLIVPEQFSFESERALYFSMGARSNPQVDVLSFTRLAHTVFREYGGSALNYVAEGGKAVLLSLALEDLKGELGIYKKSAASTGFIRRLSDTVSEFKRSGILPETLRAAVEGEGESGLARKARELALIYEAYNAFLGRGYADSDDDLSRACKLITEYNFFAGKTVFIDEFKGMTAAEMQIMRAVIAQADDVYTALCLDPDRDGEDLTGLFSGVKNFAARLDNIAKDSGAARASRTILTNPVRFKTPELAFLERNIFSSRADKTHGLEISSLCLINAKSLYDEMEYVFAEIKALLREKQGQGLCCRDIVIIGRNIDEYRNALERGAKLYNIPVFYGVPEPVYTKPLPCLVTALLSAAVRNYDCDEIFSALKTGLCPISPEESAALENYVYTWNIRGAMWESEFTQNPRGFVPDFTEEDALELALVNRVREYIISPIKKFREETASVSGLDFTIKLCGLLSELKIDENYQAFVESTQDVNLKDEYVRVWGMFCDVLDEMGKLIDKNILPLKKFALLFELMLEFLDMGEIPRNIDETLVGDASLIRTSSPKIAFVIGANEGLFPLIPKESGIFSDAERQKLKALGLDLPDTADDKIADERFIAYKALTCASEKLYISYPSVDLKGDTLYPSGILKEIDAMFESAVPHIIPGRSGLIQDENSAWLALARTFRSDSPRRAALVEYFGKKEGGEEKIRELSRAAFSGEYKIEDKALAKKLFGQNMVLSPTRVEKYYQCPFAYFTEFGLKIKKRRRAELSPVDSGNVIHYALQSLVQKHGGKGLGALSAEEIDAETAAVLESYILEYMGGVKDKNKRFKYLYSRLADTLKSLVKRLAAEFAQSEFEPVGFELKIARDGEIQPLELLLPGGSVRIEGKVDRADVMKKGGEKYIRVIDYKSGGRDFRLSDVYYGLNMQMLIYLFSLWRKGGDRYGGVIPAGALYMPALDSAVNTARNTEGEALETERLKKFRMNGIVIDDPDVIRGMEQKAKGIFINVVLDKYGKPSASSTVASLAQMGKLKSYIESLIIKLAAGLHSGEIAAFPGSDGKKTACDWCQYKSVCGHEEDNAFNQRLKIDKAEFFERLDELE
ncbi:MAG: PD-(D/E)XK nuclease family protein [Oscillospiraceae bacterium]|nr:PD-(D/E)XK nuclease family protein [Oscillospiraceae bacterium]